MRTPFVAAALGLLRHVGPSYLSVLHTLFVLYAFVVQRIRPKTIGSQLNNSLASNSEKRIAPHAIVGGDSNLCSAVSYFSTRVGSIIGAGRLSFRVRDGSGRFPAAIDRRNFVHSV